MIYNERVIGLSEMIKLIMDIVDKRNTLLCDIDKVKDYDDIEYLAGRLINQYGSLILNKKEI